MTASSLPADRDSNLVELRAVIGAQRARVRDLEAAEERLRAQDPTYSDRRVAEERRLLFEMLLRTAELVDSMPPVNKPGSAFASDAAGEGLARVVRTVRAEIIRRLRPNLGSSNPECDPAEVEAEWTRALGGEPGSAADSPRPAAEPSAVRSRSGSLPLEPAERPGDD